MYGPVPPVTFIEIETESPKQTDAGNDPTAEIVAEEPCAIVGAEERFVFVQYHMSGYP